MATQTTTAPAEAPTLYPPDQWVQRKKAATEECKTLKAWQAGGEKGDRPATPNYDVLVAKHDNGGAETTKTRRSGGAPRAVPNVRYNRKGVDVKDSMNKLSTIAYFFSGRIESPDSKRLGAKAFRELLVKLGVANPETSTWSVELPNGEIIGATVNGEKPAAVAASTIAPAAKPAKAAPAKKAVAKKTTRGNRQSKATGAVSKTTAKKAPAKKSAPAKATVKKTGKTQVTPRPKTTAKR